MTDEGGQYYHVGKEFARHETINHSADEYVRGDVHTNTVEGYFSILKRGIIGTYHHVSPQHLKRYLGEFDFRYNERMALGVNDKTRTRKAIKGIAGKRLTYRNPDKQRTPKQKARAFLRWRKKRAEHDARPLRRYPRSCQAN